jgi:hypothetical protein
MSALTHIAVPRVRRKRQRLRSNGSIESDPAVNVRARGVSVRRVTPDRVLPLLLTNASPLGREWGLAIAAAGRRLQTLVRQLPYPGSIRRISAISDRRFTWCSRLNSSQPVIHSGSPMPCCARRRKASRSAPHDCPWVAIRNSWSDRPRTSSLAHSLTICRKTTAFHESSREPRTSRTCGPAVARS